MPSDPARPRPRTRSRGRGGHPETSNEIVGKPYKWGGGHARLIDRGYDCSGSKHEGRHITLYASKGHVYMDVAGLRLDTSPVSDPTGKKGPRWRQTIGRRAGFKTRHPNGL